MKSITVNASMAEGTQVTADVRGHKLVIDQPVQAGGRDEGPTPLELFLFSLGGCIASIARLSAGQKGINLKGMDVEVKAALNPAVLLGKTLDERAGFQTITIQASIDAELTLLEKEAFLDEVCQRCPLHDNIKLATEVTHCI